MIKVSKEQNFRLENVDYDQNPFNFKDFLGGGFHEYYGKSRFPDIVIHGVFQHCNGIYVSLIKEGVHLRLLPHYRK